MTLIKEEDCDFRFVRSKIISIDNWTEVEAEDDYPVIDYSNDGQFFTAVRYVLAHGEDKENNVPPFYWYLGLQNTNGEEAKELAEKLKESCLDVIELADLEYGLVLNSGGMDLAWEIVLAFMVTGSYPPIDYCDLPNQVGRGETLQDLEIVKACNRTLDHFSKQYQATIKQNNNLINKGN